MRPLVRGERVALSELAAIHHRWEIEIAVEAPVYIVDFCCLGLDENGEVTSDDFIINFNRPDAPGGAIQLNNASNNGAVFSLALEQLPPRVRRLVFTASIGDNPLPGGLVGAAFSLFGLSADIGRGHIILATPAAEMAWFEFSGHDFGGERTLVAGEMYLRDKWRFVAAGQPLRGELGAFLRTLTDGPTPAPRVAPVVPLSAPARPARPLPAPTRSALQPSTPQFPTPQRVTPTPTAAPPRAPQPLTVAPTRVVPTAPPHASPTPAAPIAAPVAAPVAAPTRITSPLAPAPATIVLPSDAPTAIATAAPVVAAPVAAPVAPLNFPQIVPKGGKLQDLIDAAAPGSTLILQRGEYPGPLVIAKPLTLEGQGSAVWCREGPVVTLASPGVWLHDLDLEITVASEETGAKGAALWVERAEGELELEGVHLRGRIAGLGAGDGVWTVARALDLGEFAARESNEFRFGIQVAAPAVLNCAVGGIEISPPRVEAGAHQITLRARDFAPDTLLVGQIEIAAPGLKFVVSLRGSARIGIAAAQGVEIGGA